MKISITYGKYMDYTSVLGKTQNGRQEEALFSCPVFGNNQYFVYKLQRRFFGCYPSQQKYKWNLKRLEEVVFTLVAQMWPSVHKGLAVTLHAVVKKLNPIHIHKI